MKKIGEILKSGPYAEKMKDERWIFFAQGVRGRKGNFCQICKRGNIPTQVHHPFYEEREPWDYEDTDVMLLCFTCHKELHDELKRFRKFVFKKLTSQSLRVLNGALTVGLDIYDPLVLAHALAEFVSTPGMIQRFAAAWDRTALKDKNDMPRSVQDKIEQQSNKPVESQNPS